MVPNNSIRRIIWFNTWNRMESTLSYGSLQSYGSLMHLEPVYEYLTMRTKLSMRIKLTINANKTEFIYCCKPSKNDFARCHTLKVKSQIINTATTVKHLGVHLDQNLKFQDEVKNILRKMATGINTLYAIRDIFPIATQLLLLNALVSSYLHYSAILLNGISEDLTTTFEKQLNWEIKACFNSRKFDYSTDLKIRHKILLVQYFLDYKCLLYLWKKKNSLIPAFNRKLHLPTAKTKIHKRTN